jgi:hypothetical protein
MLAAPRLLHKTSHTNPEMELYCPGRHYHGPGSSHLVRFSKLSGAPGARDEPIRVSPRPRSKSHPPGPWTLLRVGPFPPPARFKPLPAGAQVGLRATRTPMRLPAGSRLATRTFRVSRPAAALCRRLGNAKARARHRAGLPSPGMPAIGGVAPSRGAPTRASRLRPKCAAPRRLGASAPRASPGYPGPVLPDTTHMPMGGCAV